jgi:hypothetical protein
MDARFHRLLGVLAVALATIAGCEDPEPALEVSVCGDLQVPRQMDAVRVSLLGPDRTTREEGVIELLKCPAGDVEQLPIRTSFAPPDGEGWIVVQGLSRGAVVARVESRLETEADESIEIRLPLTESCLGAFSCPAGQTCLQGECRVAPVAGETDSLLCESRQTADTLPDAASDTGDVAGDTATASTMDATTGDAGSPLDATAGDTGSFDPRTLCPGYEPEEDSDAADTASDLGETD